MRQAMIGIARKIVLWLMYAAAACIGVFVIYLFYRFMRIYWAPAILVAYLTSGVLMTSISIFVSWRTRRGFDADAIMMNVMRSQFNWRHKVQQILEYVSSVTGGWIPAVIFGIIIRSKSFMSGAYHANLYLPQKNVSPMMLCFVLMSIALYYMYPQEIFWIKIFLSVALINVVIRQITYAVSSQSLPMTLRRSIGNAYVAFLIIALCDVSAIILSIDFFTNADQGDLFDLSRLRDIATAVFFGSFVDLVRAALESKNLSIQSVSLTCVGALLSFNFLETIYKFKEFGRSDEDNVTIANSYNMVGMNVESLNLLDRVKKRDAAYYQVRARANTGVMQIHRAWDDARNFLSLSAEQRREYSEASSSVSDDAIFQMLVGCMILIGGSRNSFKSLIRTAFERGVSDRYIFQGLLSSVTPPNNFLSDDVIAMLETLAVSDRYGLTSCWLSGYKGELDRSKELASGLTASKDGEVFCLAFMHLLNGISDPSTTVEEDRSFFLSWSDRWLNVLGRTDMGRFEVSDAQIAAGILLGIVGISKKYGPEDVEAWKNVLFLATRNAYTDPTQQRAFRQVENSLFR